MHVCVCKADMVGFKLEAVASMWAQEREEKEVERERLSHNYYYLARLD